MINLLAIDELYDLESDPGEMSNQIAAPHLNATRNALHDRLLDWMNRTRDPFRGYYWERRPWRADARPASWPYTGYTRQSRAEDRPLRDPSATGIVSCKCGEPNEADHIKKSYSRGE